MTSLTLNVPDSQLDECLEWFANQINFEFVKWLPDYRNEDGEIETVELQRGSLYGVTLWRIETQSGSRGFPQLTSDAAEAEAESLRGINQRKVLVSR